MNANDLIFDLSNFLNTETPPKHVLNSCAVALGLNSVWLFEETPHNTSFIYSDKTISTALEIQHLLKTLVFKHSSSYFSFCNVSDGLICQVKLAQSKIYLFFSNLSDQNILDQSQYMTIFNLLRAYFLRREEQQRFKHDLFKVEDTFWQLINQVPILICSVNENLKVTLWNKECERLFGWTLEEMNQMPDALRTCYPDEKTYQKLKSVLFSKSTPKLIEWTPLNRKGHMLTTQWASVQLPSGQYMNVGIDLTEQRQIEKVLKQKLYIDDLTQCYSRATIIRKIDEHLCRVYDETLNFTPFCVFILDLDFFKKINDTWGHLAGDQALCHFSDLLKKHQKHGISIGRFGGEEFIILLDSAQAEDIFAFDQTLRLTLKNNPLYIQQQFIALNYSAGFVTIHEGFCATNSVISSADKALYRAKKSGRGQTFQSKKTY